MINVYFIKCCLNNKGYVGITSKTVEERWQNHLREAKRESNCALHRAIRKHGELSFVINKLQECDSWKDACETEIRLIGEYKTHVSTDMGYNMTIGGDGAVGYVHTDETRKRISLALTGKIVSAETRVKFSKIQTGKHASEETKRKMSLSAGRGSEHHSWGKHASEETKRKMSESHKGVKHSEETKQKIKAACAGKRKMRLLGEK